MTGLKKVKPFYPEKTAYFLLINTLKHLLLNNQACLNIFTNNLSLGYFCFFSGKKVGLITIIYIKGTIIKLIKLSYLPKE